MLICENNLALFTIPFNCSHILYGIVAYHIIRQTLFTNALNFSYVHIEMVLLCRTVNPLVIQLHRHKLCNEQIAKTRERCMHRPGEGDFTYAPVRCACVQEVSSDRSKLSCIKEPIFENLRWLWTPSAKFF